MACYEKRLTGDFDALLNRLHEGIMGGSASATYEGGSDYDAGGVRCAVRVFERYSIIGSNRVSLNVTLVGNGNELFLSAITAGGAQAIFFKINTMGENSFLDQIIAITEAYAER